MADLADCFHIYGQDLATTPSGDIALATKSQRTIRRIIRRLLTVPTSVANGSAYPWIPGYGVGLGRRVGQNLDVRGLQADVRSQMLLESTVAKTPAPVILVSALVNGVTTITVNYTDISGVPKSFSFNLSSPG